VPKAQGRSRRQALGALCTHADNDAIDYWGRHGFRAEEPSTAILELVNDYTDSLFMVFRGAVPDEANDNDSVPSSQRDDDERSTSDEPAAGASDACTDATDTGSSPADDGSLSA